MTTTTETTIEQAFTVGTVPTLQVRNVAGRITVRAGEAGTIWMKAFKHGKAEAVENTRIETEQDGDHVAIRVRSDASGLSKLRNSLCAVDFDLTVPSGCALDLHAVSADVDVERLEGTLKVETVSGDVVASTIRGTCSITTVSGNASVREVDGPVSLQTVSGDMGVQDSTLHGFDGQSVSGDVSLHTPLMAGKRYHLHTVSGDLQLHLPASTGAGISLKTVSGEMHSDLPTAIHRKSRRHWEGVINGGGAEIAMESVSGDLTLSSSDAPPEQTQSGPVSSTGTADILDRLQRGEISVEEATSRLAAMG